jgi:hypothetical protein
MPKADSSKKKLETLPDVPGGDIVLYAAPDATALSRIVGEYNFALDLLDDYDCQPMAVPGGKFGEYRCPAIRCRFYSTVKSSELKFA